MDGEPDSWNKGDFVDIVKVTGSGDLEINYRGIETLFGNEEDGQDPVSIAVVFGPDEDVRSRLFCQLLSFKLAKVSQSSIVVVKSLRQTSSSCEGSMSMSDIFFSSKSTESQRIVAWGQPVPGAALDGTKRYYYFLDIWGQFNGGREDPVYIGLAGIAAVLASTVVHVQHLELTSSSLDWIANVLNMAVKTGKVSNLQAVTFFILDWTDTESIKCGQQDGYRYLNQVLEQNASSLGTQAVSKMILDLSCYLYPRARTLPSNGSERQQHANKFLQLVLDESKPKQVSKDVDLCGDNVRNLLLDLEVKWSNMINEGDDGMSGDKASSDFLNCSESLVKNGVREGPFQIETPVAKQSIYFEILASRVSLSGLKLTTSQFLNLSRFQIEHDRVPPKKMTLLEFEALGASELSQNDEIENSNSQYQMNKRLDCTVVEASTNHPPKQRSVEDILNDIFQEQKSPQSKVAEALAVDHFATFKPSIEVKEFSINIQYSAPQLVNNASFRLQRPDLPSLQQRSTPQENVLGPVHTQTRSESDLRSFQDMVIYEVVENFKKAQLQSEISNKELYADAYRRAVQAFGNQSLPEQTWQFQLRQQLDNAFNCIGLFQAKMDELFEKQAYFTDQAHFAVKCENLFQEIVTQYGDLGALALATGDKITQLKTKYGRLNREIRSTEERCAKELLDKVKEYYIQEMNKTTLGSIEEIKTFHRTLSDKCVKGFNTAFNYPNPDINQQLVKKLDGELTLTFENIRHGLESTTKMGKDNLDMVRITLISEYKAEVERFINSPSFDNLDQLKKHQKSYFMTAVHKYITELKKNPTKDSDKVPHFKTELSTIFQDLESRATEKLSSLTAQQNVGACGSSSDLNWRVNPPSNERSNEILIEKKSDFNSSPVGIHFSLKSLTVGIKRANSFETIYGPESNTVSIGEEILIGKEAEGTGRGVSKFNMKAIILHSSLDGCFSCNKHGRCRIEVIIAFLLSKVHQITQQKLHKTNIRYVIAIPTFFNSKLQTMMTTACKIAGIECTLVLETCSLAVQLIRDEFLVFGDRQLFVAIEDENLSCEITLYEITNGVLTLTDISCARSRGIPYFWTTSGISNAFKSSNHFSSHQAVLKVGVLFTPKGTRGEDTIVKEVTDEVYRNVHVGFAKPLDVIHGTCVLASYRYNEQYRGFFNDKHKINLAELVSNTFPRGNLLSTTTNYLWSALEADYIVGMEQFVLQELKGQETKLRNKRDALQNKCLQKSQGSSKCVRNEINKIQIQIASEENSFQDLKRLQDQLNKI